MKPQTTPIKSAESDYDDSQEAHEHFAGAGQFSFLKTEKPTIKTAEQMFREATEKHISENPNEDFFSIDEIMQSDETKVVLSVIHNFASLQTTAKEKEFCERLEKQIAILRTKANNCGDSTKEQRARKGAWVDAIVMFNELFKMYHPVCKHENITRSDGLDECLDCGARNY